jgi:hypothetical protein
MVYIFTLIIALTSAGVAWAQGSGGTGFAIANELVLTNQHVVESCASLSLVIPGKKRQTAHVVAEDKEADLALIYSPGLSSSIVMLRSTPARLGEQVYAFGFPLIGTLSSSGNFTSGLVSSLRGLRDRSGELQFTAPIQPGNSGSALLDQAGLVIGVVQSKLDTISASRITGDIAQNVNFAVSGEVLTRFLQKHQVKIRTLPSERTLTSTVIARRAQDFSFQIHCGATDESQTQQAGTQKPHAEKSEKPVAFFNLPEIITELQADEGRSPRTLKITLSFELSKPTDISRVDNALPGIIKSFRGYLETLRPSDLRGSAALYRLREELLLRANGLAQPAIISDILFKEMLLYGNN